MKLITFLILLIQTPLLAHDHPGMGHMCNEYHIFGWGGGITIWIIRVAILAIIMFIAYTIFIKSKNASNSPIDILNKRYAKGEITQEEYNRMKEELK